MTVRKQNSFLKLLPILFIIVLIIIAVVFLITRYLHRTITVTFDCNAPKEETAYEPEPKQLQKGDTLSRPAFPARDGFKFNGWYLDSECTSEYNFDTPITKNMTLYAKWISADSKEAQITEKDQTDFQNVVNSFSDIYKPYRNEDGYVPKDKKNIAADQVEQHANELLQNGDLTYVSREGDSVYVEFPSGLSLLSYSASPNESSAGPTEIMEVGDKSSTGLSSITTVGVEPFVKDPSSYNSSNPQSNAWIPLTSELAYDIVTALPTHKHTGYIYRNKDVNFQNLKDLKTGSILLWDGHGNYVDKYGPVLLTKEFIRYDDINDFKKIMIDLGWAEVNLALPWQWSQEEEEGKVYAAITPRYVEKYFDLDHALVYLSTCKSGYENDNRLADAFINAGAETVFFNNGTDSIFTWYTETMMYNTIHYMTGTGKILTGTTISKLPDGIFHPAKEALELSKKYMKIFCRSHSVTYNDSSFIIDNTNIEYQDSQAALSSNSDSDYTICSGITGQLISSDNTIDLKKIDVVLTEPQFRHADIYRNGKFYFNDLPPNKQNNSSFDKVYGETTDITPYKVMILYDDFPIRVIDDIRVSEHHFYDLKEIDLSGICNLSIDVTDVSGNHLANAEIKADNGKESFNLTPSDSDNLYHAMIPQGKYHLQISAPGYQKLETDIRIVKDSSLQYELTATGKISGKILRSDNNKPIPFATVTLFSEKDSTTQKKITGPSGKYSFTKLKPGTYKISSSRILYKKQEVSITLDPNENMEVQKDIGLPRIQIGMIILTLFVGIIGSLVVAHAMLSSFSPLSDLVGVPLIVNLLLKAICIFAVVMIFCLYVKEFVLSAF